MHPDIIQFHVEWCIWRGWAWTYLNVYAVWILLFPGTMHDPDLYKITSVLVKVSPRSAFSGRASHTFNKPYMTKSMSNR